jgi:hypothetical protein
MASYVYSKPGPTPPYTDILGKKIDESAMTDKSYEYCSWDEDSGELEIFFTNDLSVDDKAILDDIVANMGTPPTGKTHHGVTSEAESISTVPSLTDKLVLNLTNVPAETYRFDWYFEILTNDSGTICEARVILDDVTVGCEAQTDDRIENVGGFGIIDLDEGDHTVKIQWRRAPGGTGDAIIKRARLHITVMGD